jgi:hypothetical protein
VRSILAGPVLKGWLGFWWAPQVLGEGVVAGCAVAEGGHHLLCAGGVLLEFVGVAVCRVAGFARAALPNGA